MSHSVAGARGSIADPEPIVRQADGWARARGGEVLLADAETVFGRDHLESAALHAERARDAGAMAARSIALEALRYVSGERQVREAIRVAGIHSGSDRIAIVFFGQADIDELLRALGWTRDDGVLDPKGKDIARLGLGPAPLATVPPDRVADLALERTALLDVEK